LDAAHQDAAVAGIEAVHQLLVVRPGEESVREAPREAVAQLFLVARRERVGALLHRRIEGAAVFLDDVRDVLGALHAALDLEAGAPGTPRARAAPRPGPAR